MNSNVIDISIAQAYASNWNSGKNTYFNQFDFQAVEAPKEIILENMNSGAPTMHLYKGLNDDFYQICCLTVEVYKNGDDFINYFNGFSIYNFLRPCSNMCNNKSPFINQ